MTVRQSGSARRSEPSDRNGKRREFVFFAVLGIAGLAVGIWGAIASAQPPSDPVAECRTDHVEADGKPVLTARGDPRTYVIRGCAQPGTPGVAEDGLWQAQLSVYGIPDAGLVERFTQAELFLTDCPVLALDYHYSQQGIVDVNRIVVRLGEVVAGSSGEQTSLVEVDGLEGVEELYPMPDRLIVLNNGRNALTAVSCEPSTALSAPGGQP